MGKRDDGVGNAGATTGSGKSASKKKKTGGWMGGFGGENLTRAKFFGLIALAVGHGIAHGLA